MKDLGRPPYTCLITSGRANALNFESEKARIIETIRSAAADGISMVQIREKALPARMLFDLASAAVAALVDTPALVLVNDRPDIALAAGAAGVHLPGNSIPAGVVRRVFGDDIVIGASTHSLEDARVAAASGADYIFFGPVFESPGKGPQVGLEIMKSVADRTSPFPVIALGGIDHDNFRDALAAGASGVAAIRSLNDTESRRRICSSLAELQSV